MFSGAEVVIEESDDEEEEDEEEESLPDEDDQQLILPGPSNEGNRLDEERSNTEDEEEEHKSKERKEGIEGAAWSHGATLSDKYKVFWQPEVYFEVFGPQKWTLKSTDHIWIVNTVPS